MGVVTLRGPIWTYWVLFSLAVLCCSGYGQLEFQYIVHQGQHSSVQFQQTTLLNGEVIRSCSSPDLQDEPRQQWAEHPLTPQQLQERHRQCRRQYEEHRSWYEKIKETTRNIAGVLQRRRGCIINSSVVSAFDEWGVNGDDFLNFDPDTLKWTAQSNMADTVAAEWNEVAIRNKVYSDFAKAVCPETYRTLSRNRSTWVNNTRNTDMEAHIYVRSIPGNAHSTLQCHLTCSDLSGVRIQLTKDGVPLKSGARLIGPRPNGDGTNQMRLQINLTDTEGSQCDVRGHSFNLTVPLSDLPEARSYAALQIGLPVGIGAVVLLLVAVGCYICYKKREGYQKSSQSDTSSDEAYQMK